jgi:Predicted nucleotidyltransferases
VSERFGLGDSDRELLRLILATAQDRIESVAVFGSRAQGTQRPNSDIDLVLYGDVDAMLCARLGSLFRESRLAISVDVLGYDGIAYAPLRAHIDRTARPLFVRTAKGLEDAP